MKRECGCKLTGSRSEPLYTVAFSSANGKRPRGSTEGASASSGWWGGSIGRWNLTGWSLQGRWSSREGGVLKLANTHRRGLGSDGGTIWREASSNTIWWVGLRLEPQMQISYSDVFFSSFLDSMVSTLQAFLAKAHTGFVDCLFIST